MTPTEQKLRQFITDNFYFEDSELLGDASLTRSGVIDSTGVMEILLFLEEQFGVKVPDEEITPENLDTIDNLVRYLDEARSRMSA